MAEQQDDNEKTEEPTQKKLDDAHRKGNVAKSQEVNTWFVLVGSTVLLMVFAHGMASGLTDSFHRILSNLHRYPVDANAILSFSRAVILAAFGALALPLLVLVVAAAAGNMTQHRLVWSIEPVKPKLSKISPLAGVKRLFSAQSLINFAKGLAKLVIVSAVMFAIVWPQRDRLDTVVGLEPGDLLVLIQTLALQLMAGVVAIMAIVAGLDFMWQQHSWTKKQKMSMKEIKDEHKQSEGDPMVRAKLRQVRMERARRRMMAAVPEATVVVTNPTHYAVALKYEPGMAAPRCVAKGVDAVALRIRDLAKEHDVPVVENPPLARALHAGVEVDDEIHPDHYKAVAEIIGYVMQLRSRAGWRANRTP